MEYFVMDHIVRCLMTIWDTFLGLQHWTRQVSWLVDLHLELLGVELLLRCGQDLDIGSFGCPIWVRVHDGHHELCTRPCALLRCAAGGYMLWCSDVIVAPGTSV